MPHKTRYIDLDLDQTIELTPGVKITLVDVDGNKVRLGFVAPQSVSIMRSELLTGERAQEWEAKHRAK